MDIIEKLNRILSDTTAHAMGSVDISQGPYGGNLVGMRQRKRKKKCKDADVVTELAAFLRKRSSKKRVESAKKLADRQKKLQFDRYKLTPSEIKSREENLEAAKKRARRKMFGEAKKTFKEWMDSHFPYDKDYHTSNKLLLKKAEQKFQTTKINFDAFKKMRSSMHESVDWIFYEGQADDLMDNAHKYDANPKTIKDKDIRMFAKKGQLDFKNLKVAYNNRKNKYDPEEQFK